MMYHLAFAGRAEPTGLGGGIERTSKTIEALDAVTTHHIYIITFLRLSRDYHLSPGEARREPRDRYELPQQGGRGH